MRRAVLAPFCSTGHSPGTRQVQAAPGGQERPDGVQTPSACFDLPVASTEDKTLYQSLTEALQSQWVLGRGQQQPLMWTVRAWVEQSKFAQLQISYGDERGLCAQATIDCASAACSAPPGTMPPLTHNLSDTRKYTASGLY